MHAMSHLHSLSHHPFRASLSRRKQEALRILRTAPGGGAPDLWGRVRGSGKSKAITKLRARYSWGRQDNTEEVSAAFPRPRAIYIRQSYRRLWDLIKSDMEGGFCATLPPCCIISDSFILGWVSLPRRDRDEQREGETKGGRVSHQNCSVSAANSLLLCIMASYSVELKRKCNDSTRHSAVEQFTAASHFQL